MQRKLAFALLSRDKISRRQILERLSFFCTFPLAVLWKNSIFADQTNNRKE